jgi:drug/metabolite transporter (DMT)-like permease
VVLRSEHERASIMQVAGIGVLVAGVAVYFGLVLPGSEAAVGVLAAAAVAIIFGGSARLGRYLAVDSHRYGGPLGLTAMAMVVGASATLILAFAIEGVPSFSVEAWLLIIWMAAINTALAYTLWAQTQRTLRAVESSVLRDMTLVQTALLGWVVLGETLDLAQVLGLALALGGVALVQLAPVLRGPSRPNTASEVGGPPEPR